MMEQIIFDMESKSQHVFKNKLNKYPLGVILIHIRG